jgi:hypothetical protein
MKALRSLILSVSGLILSSPNLQSAVPMGTVTDIKPQAVLMRADKRPLNLGLTLVDGDRIVTGESGSLKLVSVEGSLIKLGHNSELTLRQPAKGTGSVYEMAKGLFLAVVEPQGSRQFLVTSNGGVAAVKGTQLQFEAGDKGTELKVLEGKVELSAAMGKATVAVSAGEAAMSYPDRVDQARKMSAQEMRRLRADFKELVDEKKKEYARRVRAARGQRTTTP